MEVAANKNNLPGGKTVVRHHHGSVKWKWLKNKKG